MLPIHIALCTGYIPPYQLPVYQAIAQRVQRLSILVSTPMEKNRDWDVDWGGLSVIPQKTWTFKKHWKQANRFTDVGELHIPLDTWRQLRTLKPDVLVSEELGFRSIQAAMCQLLQPSMPLVLACNLSEHTEANRSWARGLVRRQLAKRATATMVNGNSGQRYLEHQGFEAGKIFRFPYVAISQPFLDCPLERPSEGSTRIVVCGQLTDRKGILPLLAVLRTWATANAERKLELLFVGDGPLRDQLAAEEVPENLTVQLLGQLGYAQIAETFGECTFLAFPTWADEWGLVVNEALAAGLPVLGSLYSQAVDELIVDGKNGWRFRPDHLDEFQSALSLALGTSPERLNAMRLDCRESVSHRTPEWAADQFIEAIRFALSS